MWRMSRRPRSAGRHWHQTATVPPSNSKRLQYPKIQDPIARLGFLSIMPWQPWRAVSCHVVIRIFAYSSSLS